MTKEETIIKLKSKRDEVCNNCLHIVGWCETHCRFSEAINIAVEAPEWPTSFNTIDRQAAIDVVIDEFRRTPINAGARAKARLETLPPVRPDLQEGEWIEDNKGNVYCSKCGLHTTKTALKRIALVGEDTPKFCSNCGAKMKGGAG